MIPANLFPLYSRTSLLLQMDTQVILVGAVVLAVLVLFATDRIRIEIVALLACLSLAWLGLLSPGEAISGFASNAVVAMAAVMVLGHGLERTGVTARIAGTIVRYAGTAERRILAAAMGTVGLLSSVVHNVGAAALFLPATGRIARRTGIPVSRLMMPVGFAAILGGTLTMIGSGPLIVLNDLLRQGGAEPFSLFAVTPVGIFLLLGGIALFVLAGEKILPAAREREEAPGVPEEWQIDQPIHACRIGPSSPLAGKTREEVFSGSSTGLSLLAVRKGGEIIVAPSRLTRFEAGQEIAMLGPDEAFARFTREWGCTTGRGTESLQELLAGGSGFGFAEIVVRPRASIAGKTPRQIMFRQTFGVEPLVHVRGETETRADFSDLPLEPGDIIVAFGSWENFRALEGHRDLRLISRPEGDPVRHGKAGVAVLIVAVSLAISQAGVPLSLALLSGAVAMVLSGVLEPGDAYRAIDWKTVVLIGGLIPLGLAVEKSGAAGLLAKDLSPLLSGAHPIVVLLLVAAIATGLSLVISNVGATVLLVPLVMMTGQDVGVDPRALALLVAVCAQNSFILPTHQVNALLMGPGGYSTRDYLRVGSIMTLLFIAIAVTIIYLIGV